VPARQSGYAKQGTSLVSEFFRHYNDEKKAAGVASHRSVNSRLSLSSALLTASLLAATLFVSAATLLAATLFLALFLFITIALSATLSGSGRFDRFIGIAFCFHNTFL